MEDLEKKLTKLKKHMKVVASLCYIENDDDEVLMLLRNKKENDMHEGKYNGLGGKSDPGEDPLSCVRREVEEEAGIRVEPTYMGNITFENFMPGIDWEVHLFRAKGYEGELKECPEGDLEWVRKENLLDLNLWDGDKVFLKYVFGDRFFFGRFEYSDGELKDHNITLMNYIE